MEILTSINDLLTQHWANSALLSLSAYLACLWFWSLSH